MTRMHGARADDAPRPDGDALVVSGVDDAPSHREAIAPSRWWLAPAVNWGTWTLIGLLLTSQSWYIRTTLGAPAPVRPLLAQSLAGSYLWALYTPGIVWLARRYGVHGRRALPHLLLHLATFTALNLLDAQLTLLIVPLLPGPNSTLSLVFARAFLWNLTCYVAIVGVVYSLDFSRLYRERAIASAELSARLSQAQLRALQSQLRPHFLFNTLNAVAEQVYTDPAAADRMIMRLGALLRASLSTSDTHEIPLRDELGTLDHYFEIMKIRHRDRLRVAVRVEPGAEQALVPAMVLQPLVENALQHGMEPSERATSIEVRAELRRDRLVLSVIDDGLGLEDGPLREGIGLRNTRERLQQLYGDRQRLLVAPRSGGGVSCVIEMPYRTH
jgi:two-component system, LytTR family, sensor kinase